MTTHLNNVEHGLITEGAGPYTLGAAIVGCQTHTAGGSQVGTAYAYVIKGMDSAALGMFEIGSGAFDALGVFTSTSVSDSSNAQVKVSWPAGAKIFRITATAASLAALASDLTTAPVSTFQAAALLLKADKTYADLTYQTINFSYSKSQSDQRWTDFLGMPIATMDTWTEMLAKMQLDDTGVATLVTVVSGKADKATTLAGYGITSTYYTAGEIDAKLTNLSVAAGSTTWGTLQGIPAVLQTPANLVLTSDSRMSDSRSPIAHAHAIGDVTGLTDALTGKAASGHSHANATTTTDGMMPAAQLVRLLAIADGATANATDATLKARGNHTGTQAIATVLALQAALDSKPSITLENGLIPTAFLPGVQDPLIDFANFAGLPATGVKGYLYVTRDDEKTYRWATTLYVEISSSPGSTDAVTEGTVNKYFSVARVLASALSGLSLVTGTVIAAGDTVLSALGKLQKQITTLGTANTGDETANTIRTKLGITTLTGNNSGDQLNITGNAGTASALSVGADRNRLDALASYAGLTWEQGDLVYGVTGGGLALLKKPLIAGQNVFYNTITGIPYYGSPIKGDNGAMPLITAGSVGVTSVGSQATIQLVPTELGATLNLTVPASGFGANPTLTAPLESHHDDFVTGAGGMMQIDHGTESNWSWYAPSTQDFQFNIRTSAAVPLSSTIAVTKSAVLVLSVKHGATPHFCTAITVDGVVPWITEWAAAAAPLSGSSNARDYYAITCKRTPYGWHVSCNMQKYG